MPSSYDAGRSILIDRAAEKRTKNKLACARINLEARVEALEKRVAELEIRQEVT